MKKKLVFLFAFVFCLSTVGFAQIVIDGDISDWTAEMQYDVLPNYVEEIGEENVIPSIDMKDIYITHDADYLYIRIDINENGALSDLPITGGMKSSLELFIDTDMSDTTGLSWGWWATGAEYWILLNVPYGIGWVESWDSDGWDAEVGIARFIGTAGTDSQWEDTHLGCTVAINADDNIMEVAIPRAAIGETASVEGTRILFYNENTSDWANADAYPNSIGEETVNYYYGSTGTTAIEDELEGNQLPQSVYLSKNYPNPFNPSTTIIWSVPEAGAVTLDVYNMLGQHVKTLFFGYAQPQAYNKVVWDGKNNNGMTVESGLYLYTLKTKDSFTTGKMMLLK